MRRTLSALLMATIALGLAACGVLPSEDSGPKVMGTAGEGSNTPPSPGLVTTLEYPPGVGGYRRFPFEGAQDAISVDLTRIMQHRRASYDDAEARGIALDAVEAAKARLAEDAPAAVIVIAGALGQLASDDIDGHVDLIGLVEVVRDDPNAIVLLQELVMTQGPVPTPPGPGSSCGEGGGGAGSCSSANPFRRVHERAVRSLDETARQGSDLARAAILTVAGSPNAAVRQTSIRSTYSLSHSRRIAKDELRKILDPDEHYLLNRY